MIRRALISVYDKTGLGQFAQALVQMGVEILSTGGTARALKEMGLEVTSVSDVTGFPEILGGRVKTLHPHIHGAILAKRSKEEQMKEIEKHEITPIDMVVVNLYPFEETVAKPDVTLDVALENIDIGGPCMIRAAAKNHPSVAVVTNPNQYEQILKELETDKEISAKTKQTLAVEAFRRTAEYDTAINTYLGGLDSTTSSQDTLTLNLQKVQDLRYGENPHQTAAFYKDANLPDSGIVAAEQLHGKELSYNNILDLNAGIGLALEFDEPCVVILKHNNPCGVAIGDNLAEAWDRALSCDPVSAFGGVVGINSTVTKELAEKMVELFLEVVVAFDYTDEALAVLTQKKNLRLLKWPAGQKHETAADIKKVQGGYLVQDQDLLEENIKNFKVATKRQPTEAELKAMDFGWKVAKWVKSNAIVFVNDNMTLGIGAGQMSRVDSSKLAVQKAASTGLDLKGSVLVSDAFFPFRDGVDAAAEAGAVAVIQPGGSVRDDQVIEAADERGMAMVFTGARHFKH